MFADFFGARLRAFVTEALLAAAHRRPSTRSLDQTVALQYSFCRSTLMTLQVLFTELPGYGGSQSG